jgi:hypothetical protein
MLTPRGIKKAAKSKKSTKLLEALIPPQNAWIFTTRILSPNRATVFNRLTELGSRKSKTMIFLRKWNPERRLSAKRSNDVSMLGSIFESAGGQKKTDVTSE